MYYHTEKPPRLKKEESCHYLRQISPVSVMLGCQILVKHFTFGGCQERKRIMMLSFKIKPYHYHKSQKLKRQVYLIFTD